MASIADGSTQTVPIPAGTSLTVGGDCFITISSQGITNRRVRSPQVFGPYAANAAALVQSNIGTYFDLDGSSEYQNLVVRGAGLTVIDPATARQAQTVPTVNVAATPVSPIANTNIVLPPGFGSLADALPVFRAAGRASRAGALTRIACLGNSTTAGFGSTGAANYIGAQRKSYPAQLANTLDKSVSTAWADNWFGNRNCDLGGGNTLDQLDPRVTLGAGWTISSNNSLGADSLINSTTTNPIGYTPDAVFDSVEITYFRNTALGSFTVNADGGSTIATINANGAAATLKTTVTVPRGTKTVNIVPPGASPVVICGVIAYDSRNAGMQVCNMGWAGARASNFAAADAFGVNNAIQVVAPHLTILANMINDWVNATTLASFISLTQATITACKVTGDVILLSDVPSLAGSGGAPAYSVQRQYVDAYRQLARDNNLVFLDWFTEAGATGEAAAAAGLKYDALHESLEGYRRKAEFVAGALLGALV